jgi:hypothetical protein
LKENSEQTEKNIGRIIHEHVEKHIFQYVEYAEQNIYNKVVESVCRSEESPIFGLLQTQRDLVHRFSKQFEQKLSLVDNCIQVCQDTLKNLQEQTTCSFSAL